MIDSIVISIVIFMGVIVTTAFVIIAVTEIKDYYSNKEFYSDK